MRSVRGFESEFAVVAMAGFVIRLVVVVGWSRRALAGEPLVIHALWTAHM